MHPETVDGLRGKQGHEANDLNKIMNQYHKWHLNHYSYYKFDLFTERIKKFVKPGNKNKDDVLAYMNKLRSHH